MGEPIVPSRVPYSTQHDRLHPNRAPSHRPISLHVLRTQTDGRTDAPSATIPSRLKTSLPTRSSSNDIFEGEARDEATSVSIDDLETCEVELVGVAHTRILGGPPHICFQCTRPIAIYGRIMPCHHIFCYSCAEKETICPQCRRAVEGVERHTDTDAMFVCTWRGCLRSYPSEFSRGEHQKIRGHVPQPPPPVSGSQHPITPSLSSYSHHQHHPAAQGASGAEMRHWPTSGQQIISTHLHAPSPAYGRSAGMHPHPSDYSRDPPQPRMLPSWGGDEYDPGMSSHSGSHLPPRQLHQHRPPPYDYEPGDFEYGYRPGAPPPLTSSRPPPPGSALYHNSIPPRMRSAAPHHPPGPSIPAGVHAAAGSSFSYHSQGLAPPTLPFGGARGWRPRLPFVIDT